MSSGSSSFLSIAFLNAETDFCSSFKVGESALFTDLSADVAIASVFKSCCSNWGNDLLRFESAIKVSGVNWLLFSTVFALAAVRFI